MFTRVAGTGVPEAPRSAPGASAVTVSIVALASLLAPVAALAQSSGTVATEEELTEVTVTARRGPRTIGNVTEQNAAKSRVTVTDEYLQTQAAGQTVFQSINLVPGVNFTNNDPYGASGGNLRIRSFDGSRVSVTFDGLPLNDTGNYALFTSQMLDPELIAAVDVNLGTTDVDSPTASATGGTVAYRTRRPLQESGGTVVISKGDFGYNRTFLSLDSGEFGPWNTTAFIAGSYQSYNKFKGPGELQRKQINARLYQDLGDRGFMSLGFHFNRGRNNFYRTAAPSTFATLGRNFDNEPICQLDSPTPGVADNDGTGVFGACSNYYNLRFNPSDTGNIRGQALFNVTDNVRLTFDPSFQYTLANGGGTNTLAETPSATATDRRIIGASTAMGVDLNGDGDLLDSVRFYTPNTTNTKRWGLTTSAIWDVTESQRLRFAYTIDYGKHRQTGQWGYVDLYGNPEDVFAGRNGRPVLAADGSEIRGRDRFSIAKLSQLAAEYRGRFLDEALTLNVGLRAPEFTRELNQYCYTPNGGTGAPGSNPGTNGTLCTTQSPVVTLPNGNVRFSTAANAPELVPPWAKTLKFDDVLPNLGVTWKFAGDNTIYFSYAEGLSAPRTDNLYAVRRQPDGSIGSPLPDPETTKSLDLGWRYNSETLIASVALWKTDYTNRIVQAFDADLGFSVDRNLGDVDLQGVDAQIGWQPLDSFTITASASYTDTEVQDDPSSTADDAFAGKQLVETPEWTFATRFDWAPVKGLRFGLQGKFVDDRFGSDDNNPLGVIPSYTIWDLDASYELPIDNVKRTVLQLNVINLFDEEYFGNISSVPVYAAPNSLPFVQIGTPRTVMVSARVEF
jgi:iron complex outermembrane receptor protein